jgi:transcriptional antiterminator RfaH
LVDFCRLSIHNAVHGLVLFPGFIISVIFDRALPFTLKWSVLLCPGHDGTGRAKLQKIYKTGYMNRSYQWYTLYVRSHHEKMVFKYLSDSNIHAYLPLTRIVKKWSDRVKWIEEPLFANYLFVKISCREYYQVLNHRSVYSFVTFNGSLASVNEQVILTIQWILAQGLTYEIKPGYFELGHRVEFSHGPFFGLTGEVVKYQGNSRILVRIDHLNQSILVKTDPVNLIRPLIAESVE